VRRVGRVAIIGLMTLSSLTIAGFAHPAAIRAGAPDSELHAVLDGKPIPAEAVGRYYCDDFSYPEIRCSSTPALAEARAKLVAVLAAIDYVTIYDQSNYGGAFMHVSQDYSALTFIGWNDRISSFKGRNSETGTFYVDWFYSGASWGFCCNTQTPNLGIYNNTFSSIIRT
jgi:hypothetical protein